MPWPWWMLPDRGTPVAAQEDAHEKADYPPELAVGIVAVLVSLE